jgi:hypothetical protein
MKTKSKLPMAYRCHKNFFGKVYLKTPLGYHCHRPICIAVGKGKKRGYFPSAEWKH